MGVLASTGVGVLVLTGLDRNGGGQTTGGSMWGACGREG